MQKLIITAIASLLMLQMDVLAQDYMLEVKRYPDYANDYLTITDSGIFYYTINSTNYIDSYKIELAKEGELLVQPGLVITEINGTSTKGMSETEFYSILESSPDSITVCLWYSPKNTPKRQTIYPSKEWPKELNKYGITLQRIRDLKAGASPWGHKALKDREKENKRINKYTTELIDSDFDWFYARTYDFAISGNDPLMDKTLLEEFAKRLNMSRDTENPDILLTVAKNADESIQTTYIPPSSRTVNLGSTTRSQYNFFTKSNDYITRQNNYTINEGGYAETTRDANIFLELTMLDASKVEDTLQSTPPIIWQMISRRHVVNPQFNLNDELMAYCTWAIKCDNSWDKSITANLTAFYPAVKFSDLEIIDVKENCNAWKSGLRLGDIIVKYKYSKKGKWIKNAIPNISNSSYTTLRYCIIRDKDGKTKKLENVCLNISSGNIEFLFWK